VHLIACLCLSDCLSLCIWGAHTDDVALQRLQGYGAEYSDDYKPQRLHPPVVPGLQDLVDLLRQALLCNDGAAMRQPAAERHAAERNGADWTWAERHAAERRGADWTRAERHVAEQPASARGVCEDAAGDPGNTADDRELLDLERQIMRQKKATQVLCSMHAAALFACSSCAVPSCKYTVPRALQLATIKAKSEALRLRQEYELEKFRAKYRGLGGQDAHSDAQGPAKCTAAAAASASSSSDGSLSIRSDEAFDEPLKVRGAGLLRSCCAPQGDRTHVCSGEASRWWR
jgi:hypothetical protein